MKKNKFLKILVLGVVAILMLSLAACGNDSENNTSGDGANNNNVSQSNNEDENLTSMWGLQINGKSIQLPCTLADLARADIGIYEDYDRENVLGSENETFTMIAATCGSDTHPIHLKITTGSDAGKQEANATVKIITNTKMDGSLFKLKNNIALGSSLDDVIKAFGENYNLSGATEDDIHNGYTVINYGTKASGAMFNFENGVLTYIEILADEGE